MKRARAHIREFCRCELTQLCTREEGLRESRAGRDGERGGERGTGRGGEESTSRGWKGERGKEGARGTGKRVRGFVVTDGRTEEKEGAEERSREGARERSSGREVGAHDRGRRGYVALSLLTCSAAGSELISSKVRYLSSRDLGLAEAGREVRYPELGREEQGSLAVDFLSISESFEDEETGREASWEDSSCACSLDCGSPRSM